MSVRALLASPPINISMLGPGGKAGDSNLCFPACKQDGGDGSSMIDFMGPGTDGGDGYSIFVSVRSYSRWGDGTNFTVLVGLASLRVI